MLHAHSHRLSGIGPVSAGEGNPVRVEGTGAMAGGISARLSRAEARRFGLVVGAAFLVLSALFWWRGRPLPGQISGGVGAILILAGIMVPLALRPVYRAWMGMALAISRVTTPII